MYMYIRDLQELIYSWSPSVQNTLNTCVIEGQYMSVTVSTAQAFVWVYILSNNKLQRAYNTSSKDYPVYMYMYTVYMYKQL